jgi:3-oxoadipate enol-lactonase
MEYTSNAALSLRYDTSGEGEGLVLLHELGGCLDSWDGVLAVLPKRFRVLRYDQRGAGMSEKVRQPFSLADQVLDLESVLAAAAMPKALWIVGAAAGAAIAVAYAVRHPERIKGLILCSPALSVDAERTAYLESRSQRAAENGMRAVLDESLARSYPPIVIRDRAVYEQYCARFLANDPITYGFASRVLVEAGIPSIDPRVACPCLLLAGEHDGLRPPDAVRKLADALPGTRFMVLDSGHFMHVQTPQLVVDRFVEFTCSVARVPDVNDK